MTKKNVAEDTKTQFQATVNDKVNKADKPAEIDTGVVPGQSRNVLNKTAVTRPSDNLPDYATTSKDSSKSSKVSTSGPECAVISTDVVPGQSKGVVPEEDMRTYLLNKLTEMYAKRAKENVSESVDMSEHITALFEGTDFSDEFKAKTTTIFETAVNVEVEAIVGNLVEASLDTISEELDSLVESYDSKIEEVLAYVVEQWLEQNQVALEQSLKAELVEDFITGLSKLFAEHYISVPEEKIDVAEALAERVAALEDKLNEQIEVNIQLNAHIVESEKKDVVKKLSEGLTAVDASKFATLCEATEADNAADYEAKIRVLRESYITKKSSVKVPETLETERVLTEEEQNSEAKTETKTITEEKAATAPSDPRVAAYLKSIKRFSGK